MGKSELCHYGVLGMKWGVRRYQNEDGTLTSAGKKRYENADGSLNDKGKEFYKQADAYRRSQEKPSMSAKKTELAKQETIAKTKDELRKVEANRENIADNAGKLAKDLRNLSALEQQTRPAPTKEKLDLSSMSDEEMRKKINRELLERQYNDMFAPVTVDKGRERVGQVLAVAGTIATVAATGLSIAVSIKKLVD